MSEQVKRFIVDMKGTGVECVFASDYATLQAECEKLREDLANLRSRTSVTMGVGTGDGNLFVHGDYESIKAAQKIVFELGFVRAELAAIKAQEPVGWITDDYKTDKSATTYDSEVAERWRQKGWTVVPIYF